MKTHKFYGFLILSILFFSFGGHANSLSPLNPSVWTDYSRMDFEGYSQEEKTHKLQLLFADKVAFCKNQSVRRAIIRILDPGSFDFFNPEKFDHLKDDNFLYWALELGKVSDVEALFDNEAFRMSPPKFSDRIFDFAKYFFRVENTFPFFNNLLEKVTWVSLINDFADPSFSSLPIVKGMTIHPKGLNEGEIQLVINALDQYKHNASELLPPNHFSSLRTGMVLNLDHRNLAFLNLARFPLYTDVRSLSPNSTGLPLPENFPSTAAELSAPSWRSENNAPLLDTVYVNLADPRLVDPIYQNLSVMKDPTVSDVAAAKNLSELLSHTFTGVPFVKGPGKITVGKGCNTIEGKYTFFRTGTQKNHIGKFDNYTAIEVRPPFVEETMTKYTVGSPVSNKEMKVTSSFSTTIDISDADYYMNPVPIRWNATRVSNHLISKIYYVLSTEFTPPHERYMGNWHLDNFLEFVYKSNPRGSAKNAKGFLTTPIYWGLSGTVCPVNNLVLYDFTTIPNGYPYPECDWKLGNKTHK